MISSCYVFVVDEHEPRICGKYTIQDGVGYFVYGKSWLSREDAYPLDPINYPLIDTTFQAPAQHEAIGVLSDSTPDSWGRQVHRLPINNSLLTRWNGYWSVVVEVQDV